MAHKPAEIPQFHDPYGGLPLFPDAHSTQNAPSTMVDPSIAAALYPDHTFHRQRRDWRQEWKHHILSLVPGQSIVVFIILLAVTLLSFAPAFIVNKNSADLIILEGSDPPTDGVGSSDSSGHDRPRY